VAEISFNQFHRAIHGIDEPEDWPQGPPGPRVRLSSRELDILDDALEFGRHQWRYYPDVGMPSETEAEAVAELLRRARELPDGVSFTLRQIDMLVSGLIELSEIDERYLAVPEGMELHSGSNEAEREAVAELLWQHAPPLLSDTPDLDEL
jgi:hypothetical protein